MVQPPAPATEPGIADHFATLGRRKVTIAVIAALAVISALVVSLLQTPTYRSQAQVQVPTSGATLGEDTGAPPERIIRNEVDFVESDAVTAAVEEALGDDADISVGSSEESDTLRFTAVSTDADEAAEIANTYAETYITVRLEETQATLAETRASIERRIQSINQTVAQVEGGVITPQAQARLDGLVAERVELQTSLRELQLSSELTETGGPQLIRRAEAADSPFEPNLTRNLAIALGVGLLLGVGMAFVREQLDDTVTSRADLEEATGGLPVLGLVPHAGDRRDRAGTGIVTLDQPNSAAAEAYRSLRTSVQFLGVERNLRTLLVTSPGAGDGKTTTVANLAVAMSRAGRRCAIVSGDLRRPAIHSRFGLDPRPGLTTVLLGESTPDAALRPVPGEANLFVLPAGELPPNPSELLSTDGTAKLLEAVADAHEIVLIDAPPVLPVTDALVLAQQVDGVILVADARRTGLAEVREAAQRLQQVGAPLVGAVLNDAEDTAGTYAYD